MRLARHGKKILAGGLMLCMMCGIAGCGGMIPTQGEAPQETPLTMESAAFQLGVRDHLGGYQYGTWRFNGYEQETFDSLIASVEDDLKLLDELEAQSLSEEEKTECKILREALENEKTLYQNRLYWEPNKTFFGEHAGLPLTLEQMPIQSKADAENAVSLMQDTGRFLDSILAFQQEKAAAGLLMSEEALNESITFCRNFVQDPQNIYLIGLFNGKVDALQDASEEEKTQLKHDYQTAVVEVLAPAYGRLADGLEALKPQCAGKGLGQTEEGKAYYGALIWQKTGSDRSADDMIAMLDEALKQNDRDWTRMMDRDGGLQRKVQNSTLATKDPNVILNTLQTQILSDFPAVETETYSIEHTNEQIKDNGTGGVYYTSSNTIYLSDAEAQSQSNLYLTLAHEGFPGHLYQKSYAKNLPHALFRGNAVFEGYEEGWATYVELYSAKYAQDTDLKRDFLANEAIGSDLISARIDLGVNHQGWGKKEIKSLLRKYQYDTDAETVNYYWNEAVSSPGESLAYAIGYLEIMELKTYAQTELGDAYTDLAFHQAVLDAGPSPFWHVRDCVEAYVSKNKPQPEAQEQPAADTSFLAVAA